ncbi:unnamed protein product, partial [Effrenium voratum]
SGQVLDFNRRRLAAMEEEHFDVSSSFGFSEPRSKICGVDSTDLAQARSSFGQALRRHLAELQKRLLAEHEALFSDDHRHSLEKLVESLKEENDRLRMQEDSHANISSPTASSYKEERLDRNTRRSTASRRSVAKLRSRRSSFKGINLNDPRSLRARGASTVDEEPTLKEEEATPERESKETLLRTALAAWKEYTFQVMDDDDEEESDHEIEAVRAAAHKEWPEDCNGSEWQALTRDLTRAMSGDLSASKDPVASKPFFRKLVSSPASKRRMVWDVLGLFLVIWDIFAIPMNAFESTDVFALYMMSFISTLFWTIDFPTNFFNGFYRAGVMVTNPRDIACQYLRTWFSIDLGVLTLDWFFIAFDLSFSTMSDEDAAGNNYFRIARMSRGLRVLRILRLVRLAKLFPKFHSAFVVVQSDFIRLSMGAWFAVVIVVVMNHYVACAWFALGYWDLEADVSWVKAADLEGAKDAWKLELTYQYFTSLHWALCQFTPATMEVMATNTLERIFTVCTIILGLISFSSFVSNITSSMTQLRNLNSEKHKLQSSLRTFFAQNEVPPEVSKCIYDWIHSHRKSHRLRVHEQDIDLLAELPERLRFKLREAVYRPVLYRHPFFKEFGEVDAKCVDRLCHSALSEIRIGTEHTVFIKKEEASGMYFVMGGELDYWRSALQEPTAIGAGEWLSEIALWVSWRHTGTLSARCASDLMLLDADMFRSILSSCNKVAKRMSRLYAAAFVRHECEAETRNDWLCDTCCSSEAIGRLLEKCWRNSTGDTGIAPMAIVSPVPRAVPLTPKVGSLFLEQCSEATNSLGAASWSTNAVKLTLREREEPKPKERKALSL